MMKDLVADHIERCRKLTPKQIEALENTLGSMLPGTLSKRAVALHKARKEIGDAPWHSAWDADWYVGTAAWDTAIALIAKDIVTPEEFENLVAPWVSVMGRTWEA